VHLIALNYAPTVHKLGRWEDCHAQDRHRRRARTQRLGLSAAFPKSSGNGHHLINKSSATAVYLEVGTRSPADVTICSDIDMMSSNADGRFVHKDGTPYPEP